MFTGMATKKAIVSLMKRNRYSLDGSFALCLSYCWDIDVMPRGLQPSGKHEEESYLFRVMYWKGGSLDL